MTTEAERRLTLLPGSGHLLQGYGDASMPLDKRVSENQSVKERARGYQPIRQKIGSASEGEEISSACSEELTENKGPHKQQCCPEAPAADG